MSTSSFQRLFDPFFFLSGKGVPDAAFDNPEEFYREHWREHIDLDPNPLFDQSYYLEQLGVTPDISPLEHYLQSDGERKPNPNIFFDEEYYVSTQMLPGSGPREMSALEHYLRYACTSRPPSPNRAFDGIYFQRHNRDIHESRINPLEKLLHETHPGTRLVCKSLTRSMLQVFDYRSGPTKENYKSLRCILLYFDDVPDEEMEAALESLKSASEAGICEFLAITTKQFLPRLQGKIGSNAVLNKHMVRVVGGEPNQAELALLLKGVGSSSKPTWVFYNGVINPRFLTNTEHFSLSEVGSKLEAFNKPAKITERPKVIIPISDWQISGVNTWVANITLGLQKRGYEVELLCCHDFYRFTSTASLPPVPLRILNAPSSKPELWWAVVRDYVNGQTNAVFLTAYDFQFNAIVASIHSHIPMIGVIHSDDPVYYLQCERVGGFWHHIITVSAHIGNELKQRHPDWADKISTVHYGVEKWAGEIAAPPAPTEPIRIVYTGRIVHLQKRLLDLPILVEKLVETGTPFKIDLIGDGPEKEELEKLLAPQIQAGMITMHGRVPPSEIDRLLSESHIFLLISDFEGLPLSLLEAMAHGVVPVVSDIASGIPEVIHHGETGYRIPIGDYAKFAETISLIHADPSLWNKISQQARDFFNRELSVDVMTSRTEKIINEVSASENRESFVPSEFSRDQHSQAMKMFGDVITNLIEA